LDFNYKPFWQYFKEEKPPASSLQLKKDKERNSELTLSCPLSIALFSDSCVSLGG